MKTRKTLKTQVVLKTSLILAVVFSMNIAAIAPAQAQYTFYTEGTARADDTDTGMFDFFLRSFLRLFRPHVPDPYLDQLNERRAKCRATGSLTRPWPGAVSDKDEEYIKQHSRAAKCFAKFFRGTYDSSVGIGVGICEYIGNAATNPNQVRSDVAAAWNTFMELNRAFDNGLAAMAAQNPNHGWTQAVKTLKSIDQLCTPKTIENIIGSWAQNNLTMRDEMFCKTLGNALGSYASGRALGSAGAALADAIKGGRVAQVTGGMATGVDLAAGAQALAKDAAFAETVASKALVKAPTQAIARITQPIEIKSPYTRAHIEIGGFPEKYPLDLHSDWSKSFFEFMRKSFTNDLAGLQPGTPQFMQRFMETFDSKVARFAMSEDDIPIAAAFNQQIRDSGGCFSDIMKLQAGVCREMAVSAHQLLRSFGVQAEMVGGRLGTGDYSGHAWIMLPGNLVYDPAQKVLMHWDQYEKAYEATMSHIINVCYR